MLLHGSSSLLVPSVLVIIVAAAYSLISVHTSAQGYGLTVPNTDLRLGEGGYDIESLMTPSLTGWQLQLFAWASTHSPSLVRLLLNTNGVHKLRALAQQVPPSTPPVLLPLVRLTTSERARHAALAVEPDSATLAAWRFSASDATDPTFWSVEDYAVAYRSGKADPPSVVARVYAAIDASRERLGRPFVETRRTEALAAAAASAERIAAGKAIGIFDGVPIAVKDEVDVARYKSAHGTVGDDYIFVATGERCPFLRCTTLAGVAYCHCAARYPRTWHALTAHNAPFSLPPRLSSPYAHSLKTTISWSHASALRVRSLSARRL